MNRKLQCVAYVLACSLSLAATGVHADNSQQSKMKTCNADATTKNLTGNDRKAYLKTCLSATPAAAASTGNSQQQKMKTCNADASSKKLTGNDRKAYMKTCLSASPPATSAAAAAPVPAAK